MFDCAVMLFALDSRGTEFDAGEDLFLRQTRSESRTGQITIRVQIKTRDKYIQIWIVYSADWSTQYLEYLQIKHLFFKLFESRE